MIHLIFASLTALNAGILSRLCMSLIADDPYQFETAPDDWLKREAFRLGIRIRWNKATASERVMYDIIEKELERRRGEL